ncbi:guanine nucleotide-binding protein G(I)/G(S)/G(O) subunit gamma-2 isoform X1 [Meriones unguiculatus]|uniref:guanine nucleotide-binding protein G(I)/G(S)/G(O) subunit gamma-2 isoform X1 n=1 Tax=Meriones unguiculatus TaxID=10047 RepID=UPI00293EF439|nr:guanine nucleotide-binding protein G(I)/G(S)/G(O) subunit gamma-2 isoform X1 [Meriones unguiculatus]
MEYYSAIKNKEIMKFAGKWELEKIILNEVSQKQKDTQECLKTPSSSPMASNNTASIAQARKLVEQLKMEANIDRIKYLLYLKKHFED